MATGKFEPYTIEITKQLHLSEADERARATFRAKAFEDEDSIINMAIGPGVNAERRILWARFGEFVQSISVEGIAREIPVHTEEITRRYRVQAAS